MQPLDVDALTLPITLSLPCLLVLPSPSVSSHSPLSPLSPLSYPLSSLSPLSYPLIVSFFLQDAGHQGRHCGVPHVRLRPRRLHPAQGG